MFKTLLLFGMAMVISISSLAQKNPHIDKAYLFTLSGDPAKASNEYYNAEKYYRKGEGTYDEALKYYLRLYEYGSNDKALNYKIGVCYLGSSNKKAALKYLQESSPEIAIDYYLLLGKAYQYNFKYSEAREAYEKFFELQNNWSRKKKLNHLMQLKRECLFGQTALKDSTPVFIYNMGPIMNTYYDDYNAYMLPDDSVFLYTTRRPKKEPRKRTSRFKFNEKILYSDGGYYDLPEETYLLKNLKRSKHNALAGYNYKEDKLYYYRGKKNNGDIYSAEFKKGKAKKQRNIHGKVNHIAYKETSFSVSDNGVGYFVSDRRGGEGGKDIWQCKKVGNNRYGRLKNMGNVINTPFDEECVYITPDGNTLYFSSNGHEGMGGFDVFKSEKLENGTWTNPVNLGYPINSPADELFYHPTQNPDIALYAAVRADGYGGLDIYKIVKDNRIPFTLFGFATDNTTGEKLNAAISVFNSGDSLIATTNVDSLSYNYLIPFDDKGDFYAVVNVDGYQSLKQVIECPTVRNDSLEMDFALQKLKFPFTVSGNVRDLETFHPLAAVVSCYDADMDSLLARQVTNPENGKFSMTLADRYNVRLEIAADDYYSVTDKFNATDITGDSYKKMYNLESSKVYYNLNGKVSCEDGDVSTGVSIFFYHPGETSPFFAAKTDSTASYSAQLEEKGPFDIEIRAEGYFFYNDTVQFAEADSLHKTVNFELKKMKQGAKIVVENILFNSGKSTLKSSSYVELDKLADLLMENKDVRLEVSGHTDNVGSSAINKKISKARALAVRNYLVTKGVEEERLEYEGYGFDQPIADNGTPEGRAQNRRVEVKVIE